MLTQHAAVKQDASWLTKKHSQWLAIAIQACEQCGRNSLPTINSAMPLPTYLQQTHHGARWLLEPSAELAWRNIIPPAADTGQRICHVLVGPEGGFHADEIKQAHAVQFQACSLGPRILRAETASIAVLSVLQALQGDL